jgi:hypothetical protein
VLALGNWNSCAYAHGLCIEAETVTLHQRRRRYRVLLGIVTMLGLACIAYIARDPLVTVALRSALGMRAGFSCTHPHASLSAGLQTLTVTPFACELGRSPVQHFDTGMAVVVIRGFRPKRVEVGEVTLDYRQRDISHVEMNTTGDLAAAAGIVDGFVKSMLDACEMYSISGPEVMIRDLVSKRGGVIESRIHGFHLSNRGLWSRTQIMRLQPAGQRSVTVTDLDMQVTPSQGKMRATIHVGALPPIHVRLNGQQLAGPTARMQLSM